MTTVHGPFLHRRKETAAAKPRRFRSLQWIGQVPLVGIELIAAAEHANYTPPRLVEEAMKVKDILCVRQATRTPRSLLHSDLSCYKENDGETARNDLAKK